MADKDGLGMEAASVVSFLSVAAVWFGSVRDTDVLDMNASVECVVLVWTFESGGEGDTDELGMDASCKSVVLVWAFWGGDGEGDTDLLDMDAGVEYVVLVWAFWGCGEGDIECWMFCLAQHTLARLWLMCRIR